MLEEEIKDFAARVYENFLMRDLTYVFAGVLLLASTKYAYDRELIDAINYVSQDIFKFVIFIAVSYFIGLIVQEGCTFVGIVKTRPEKPAKEYAKYLMLRANIRRQRPEAIREMERVIYMKHIGAAIGSASFISCLILIFFPLCDALFKHRQISLELFKILDFWIVLALLLITIVCVILNRQRLKDQQEFINCLGKIGIEKRPSTSQTQGTDVT